MRKISVEIERRIKELFLQNLSYREIAAKEGVSLVVVQRVTASMERPAAYKMPVRRSCLTGRTATHFVRFISENGLMSLRDMKRYVLETYGITTSHETIRQCLQVHNLESRPRPLKPFLSHQNQVRRFNFSKVHETVSQEYWDRCIFTDECKFNLFGSDGPKRVWRCPGAPSKKSHFRQLIKHGGGSVMVWGAITSHGVGELLFIDGIMDSKVFLHTLKLGLMRTCRRFGLSPPDIILQQDNDPKHTSKMTRQWLTEHHLRVMDWPSCSPDMNPIENVWAHIKRRLYARISKPSNIQELKAAILEEWYSTPVEYVQTLYNGMPRRVGALKRAKGLFTDY